MYLVSELGEFSRDEIGRAELLECRLRMHVEIAAPSRHLIVKIRDPIDDGHDALRVLWAATTIHYVIHALAMHEIDCSKASPAFARLEAVRGPACPQALCNPETVACRMMGRILAC
jgi:hypothetical protein